MQQQQHRQTGALACFEVSNMVYGRQIITESSQKSITRLCFARKYANPGKCCNLLKAWVSGSLYFKGNWVRARNITALTQKSEMEKGDNYTDVMSN